MARNRSSRPCCTARSAFKSAYRRYFDTDRFGSFSRDVARNGSALDAARAKIAAAFKRVPQARVGLASEGSFGPHPQIPFLPVGSEIVLLIDRHSGLELSGHHLGPATNFSRRPGKSRR